MNRETESWLKLAAAARAGEEAAPVAAPYGFATRVAARAWSGEIGAAPHALLEKFAVRGLIVAATCSIAAVAFGYSSLEQEPLAEDLTAVEIVDDAIEIS